MENMACEVQGLQVGLDSYRDRHSLSLDFTFSGQKYSLNNIKLNCILSLPQFKQYCEYLLVVYGLRFYKDMQIMWPDSGSPPIRLSDA